MPIYNLTHRSLKCYTQKYKFTEWSYSNCLTMSEDAWPNIASSVPAGNGGFIEFEFTACFSATIIVLSDPETYSNIIFSYKVSEIPFPNSVLWLDSQTKLTMSAMFNVPRWNFYPATLCERSICNDRVSVHLSITSWCSTEMAKHRIMQRMSPNSPGTLKVFWCQIS